MAAGKAAAAAASAGSTAANENDAVAAADAAAAIAAANDDACVRTRTPLRVCMRASCTDRTCGFTRVETRTAKQANTLGMLLMPAFVRPTIPISGRPGERA